MSRKSFEDFYNGTSFEVYGCHKNNLKKAWEACESQHKAEISELKEKIQSLESELEKLKKENQELAAKHCSSDVLDEHGNRRCNQTGELI